MIKAYSLKPLQKALNHGLSLDPDWSEKAKPLLGKCLQIVIQPLNLTFYMQFADQGKLLLQADCDHSPDTVIYSNPIGLIRLSFLPMSQARSLFNDRIQIEGDVVFGQQVKQLFDQLDIDWEGHLAHFTGDVIAHQLGRFVRKGKAFGDQLKQSLHQNVDEYLHEETDLFPPPEEIEDFYRDIDTLVSDVDRLAAKLDLLTGKHS